MRPGGTMGKVNWATDIKPYQKPDHKKSYWQIINSLSLYIGFWFLAYQAYQVSAWLLIPVALFSQLVFLRLFIILHDCGHGSFFKDKKRRTFWGTFFGILTFTPYEQWTAEHADHHKHSGNLDHRGRGDVWTLTVEEYEKASAAKKFLYHIYRFPPFMLIFGGIYNFIIMHRFTTRQDKAKQRNSVYITNVGIVLMGLIVSALTTFEFYAIFQFFVVVFGGLFGIGLFYVQHQFEGVYWKRGKEWDYEEAALHGCTYLKLPKIVQWASGNIGFHHIHHLSPMIPNYELENCYNAQKVFQIPQVTITWKDLVKCFSLHLYDEKNEELLTFKQAKALNSTPVMIY